MKCHHDTEHRLVYTEVVENGAIDRWMCSECDETWKTVRTERTIGEESEYLNKQIQRLKETIIDEIWPIKR